MCKENMVSSSNHLGPVYQVPPVFRGWRGIKRLRAGLSSCEGGSHPERMLSGLQGKMPRRRDAHSCTLMPRGPHYSSALQLAAEAASCHASLMPTSNKVYFICVPSHLPLHLFPSCLTPITHTQMWVPQGQGICSVVLTTVSPLTINKYLTHSSPKYLLRAAMCQVLGIRVEQGQQSP